MDVRTHGSSSAESAVQGVVSSVSPDSIEVGPKPYAWGHIANGLAANSFKLCSALIPAKLNPCALVLGF